MSDGQKPPKKPRKPGKKSARNRSSKPPRGGNKTARARDPHPIADDLDQAVSGLTPEPEPTPSGEVTANALILAAILSGREPPGVDMTLPPRTAPAERKRALIELVAATGDEVNGAAKALGISRKCVWEWKRDDQHFARALDYAYNVDGTAALVSVAVKRAVQGWLEPVYFKGSLAGFVRKYDHMLLMRLIQKRDPAYRDPKWATAPETPRAPGEVSIDLDKMPPKLRAELRKEAERQAKQREGASR